MAAAYPYLGGMELWYQGYLDTATGKMLIAQPGGTYSMFPVDPGLPVPPSDGRWGAPAVPPAVVPVSVPAPAPAPAPAPQGGE